MKHPLLNTDSPHYEASGTQAIYELEKELTIPEMIGYCKGNIFKYKWRGGAKGDDYLKKIETYQNYLDFLQDKKIFKFSTLTVADNLALVGIVWE